jgi:cytochrome bd-type quinol oxidase subunit 1
MIGWIGLVLLMCAFGLLLTKHKRLFTPMDFLASLLLTIHAIQLTDPVFIVVNGWITLVMGYKYFTGNYEID